MMAWHMRASLPNLSALLLGLTTAVIEAISNPFDVMQGTLCTDNTEMIRSLCNLKTVKHLFRPKEVCTTFNYRIMSKVTSKRKLRKLKTSETLQFEQLSVIPAWSSGQDSWLSPSRPGFDSRCRKTFWHLQVQHD